MYEFFKGWRRKIGVVTLMMACVFMAGWVRSQFCGDVVTFNDNVQRSCGTLASGDNVLLFALTLNSDLHVVLRLPDVLVMTPNEIRDELDQEDIQWSWRLFGIRHGVQSEQNRIWVVPYWIIVFPLTLFSAYLLLVKPQVAKPKETIEPDRA